MAQERVCDGVGYDDPRALGDLFRQLAGVVAPPETLDVLQWLERYRRLSPEASAEPGPWRFDRTPYGKTITEAIADPNIREVCIMAASQVGKSEFATLNPILYFASVDPAPMLLICPTLQACRSMSLDRLDPMLRDSPIARPFVSEQIGGPGSDNSMFRKSFENGCQLAIVAGLSATGLSMRPVKYLFFEECSRLPLMAVGRTAEGDVIQLAKVRTSTFGSQAKIIYSSSPVEEQSCRITALFRDSTEEHYYSQCPRGHFQILGLPEMIFETGECMCLECSRSYDQATWLEREGEWRAHAQHPFRRGFHLNCFVSPFIDWRIVDSEFRAAEHLRQAGDSSAFRAFLNTRLAEPYVPPRIEVASENLNDRREVYPAEVPEPVKVLVGAIDTQDHYLQYLIAGVGTGRELWLLEFGEIQGSITTQTTDVAKQLDALVVQRMWKRSDGSFMRIRRSLMDAGGHHGSAVYRECKRRHPLLIASRGLSLSGSQLYRIGQNTTERSQVVNISPDLAKDRVAEALALTEVGPGYIHICCGPSGEAVRGFDDNFFAQLRAETKEVRYRNGVRISSWKRIGSRRNEALDCLALVMVAIESLRLNLDEIPVQTEAPAGDQSQLQPVVTRPTWGAQPVRRDIVYQPAGRSISVESESAPTPQRRYGVQNRPVVW